MRYSDTVIELSRMEVHNIDNCHSSSSRRRRRRRGGGGGGGGVVCLVTVEIVVISF